MVKYSNYFNTKETLFQYSKEYSDEEICIFQLISNKKREFLNFFSDFFMDLPGFMTIYKDKFFSKIKDFIDDNNYIFILKNKFDKKFNVNNNTNIDKEIKNYLGIKRKRKKTNDPSDDLLSAYDAEFKLLENDYPQTIDNSDEFILDNIQIKREKMDEEELNSNEINNNKIESINISKKIIKSISEKKSKTHKNKENINFENIFCENKSPNKSKKQRSIKYTPTKKYNYKNTSSKQKESKSRKGRTQNSSIKKSDFLKILTPVKNYHYNNIVTNVFDGSVLTADYAMQHYQEKNPKTFLYGINSRLDKMPKINICKKKRYQVNYSAEKLLDNIKDKLSNIKDSNYKSKNHRKRKNLSDDKKRLEELKNLNQIVNNNFYGKERFKSPEGAKLENNIYDNDENVINNKIEVNHNNKNYFNSSKKKKLTKRKNISHSPVDNVYNKNVSIKYKIILNYKKRKGEKIITKSNIEPELIIINKCAINMKEMKSLFDSLLKKEKENKNKIDTKKKLPENKTPNQSKNSKRAKKLPKKKIQKSIKFIHVRRSSRIRKLQKIKNKKEKESQKLKSLTQIKKRTKRFKKRTKTKEKKKPKKPKSHSETKNFDSRGTSSISNVKKIRTNNKNDIEAYIEKDPDQDYILVNRTVHYDSYSSGENHLSHKRSNLRNNNGIINNNNNYLDEFDAVKGFNLLFNQK